MPVRAVSVFWAPCLDAPVSGPEEKAGYQSVLPQVTFLHLASLEEAILKTRGTKTVATRSPKSGGSGQPVSPQH